VKGYKRGEIMPYHKNSQQAYQAAEQNYLQAMEVFENIDSSSPEYGHYLKRLKQEIQEAEQTIENALEVATETQRIQLYAYRDELEKLRQQIE